MSATRHQADVRNDGLFVDALSINRAGRPVLSDVSVRVGRGEIVTVLGPNGAGKTSLLEAVVGALPLSRGRVCYQGRPLRRLRDRTQVFAFMPDATEPPPEVRVARLIDTRRAEGAGTWTNELVERLGLKPLLPALVGELSRGEKRRVMLFAALRHNRPVVVLDEPLGVFDPLQLLDVLDLIRDRARAGISFLMSIHQMADAQKIASHIVLLDKGRSVAAGSIDELRAQVGCATASLEEVFLRLLRTDVSRVVA